MYHSFLIHSSANGHLGCFHVLTIINSAVMKNAGEAVEKREPSYTVGGYANKYSHYGEQYGDSLKIANRTAL